MRRLVEADASRFLDELRSSPCAPRYLETTDPRACVCMPARAISLRRRKCAPSRDVVASELCDHAFHRPPGRTARPRTIRRESRAMSGSSAQGGAGCRRSCSQHQLRKAAPSITWNIHYFGSRLGKTGAKLRAFAGRVNRHASLFPVRSTRFPECRDRSAACPWDGHHLNTQSMVPCQFGTRIAGRIPIRARQSSCVGTVLCLDAPLDECITTRSASPERFCEPF